MVGGTINFTPALPGDRVVRRLRSSRQSRSASVRKLVESRRLREVSVAKARVPDHADDRQGGELHPGPWRVGGGDDAQTATVDGTCFILALWMVGRPKPTSRGEPSDGRSIKVSFDHSSLRAAVSRGGGEAHASWP